MERSEIFMILMVHPINITPLWEQVKKLLEPALALAMTHDSESVRKSLMTGHAQLWVQWDNEVEAAVITEFKPYPLGLWLNLWLAGAKEKAHVLWQAFLEVIMEFAEAHKCVGIEDCGRVGWDRYCPVNVKKIGVMRRIILKGS